jgi:hypothetical protein
MPSYGSMWLSSGHAEQESIKFEEDVCYSLWHTVIPNPSMEKPPNRPLNDRAHSILPALCPWSAFLPTEHWLLSVVDRWCVWGLSAGSNPRLIRGPYPEAEEWLVVLLLLPPEEELLTEIMEWGRLLLRKSSPDDTVIELRNRGAAAIKCALSDAATERVVLSSDPVMHH